MNSKIKFSIHPLFIIFVLVLALQGLFDVLCAYVLTLLIHEYAHFLVANKKGYHLNKFCLMPHGISLSGQNVLFSYKDEITIALAGPICNLVISIIGFALWWLFPATYPYTQLFIYANLITGTINFLPVFPMDGGRIVLAILGRRFTRTKALKMVRILGILVSFALIGVFIATTFFEVNFTFLTLGLFCFFTSIWEDKRCVYERSHFLDSKNFNLKGGIAVREIAVIEDITLYKLVSEIRQDSITNFCVLNKNMEQVAYIEEKQIENFIKVYPATATLKTILNWKDTPFLFV